MASGVSRWLWWLGVKMTARRVRLGVVLDVSRRAQVGQAVDAPDLRCGQRPHGQAQRPVR